MKGMTIFLCITYIGIYELKKKHTRNGREEEGGLKHIKHLPEIENMLFRSGFFLSLGVLIRNLVGQLSNFRKSKRVNIVKLRKTVTGNPGSDFTRPNA